MLVLLREFNQLLQIVEASVHKHPICIMPGGGPREDSRRTSRKYKNIIFDGKPCGNFTKLLFWKDLRDSRVEVIFEGGFSSGVLVK